MIEAWNQLQNLPDEIRLQCLRKNARTDATEMLFDQMKTDQAAESSPQSTHKNLLSVGQKTLAEVFF